MNMNGIARAVVRSIVWAVLICGWRSLAWGMEYTATWNADGGEDRSISNAANWGGALPDLTHGTTAPNFLNGTGAVLDQSVWFLGVRLVPKNFSLSASAPDAVALIGAGGVETAGRSSKRSYTWGWPTVLKADQLWNAANNDELNVTAQIASEESVRWTLGGSGTNNLSGPLSLPGVLAVTNGTVNVSSTDLVAGGVLEVDAVRSRLCLNGATLRRDVKNVTDSDLQGYIFVAAGTVNTVNGDLDLSAPYDTTVQLGPGATLVVTGQLRRRGESWVRFLGDSSATATCRLDGQIDAEPGVNVSIQTGVDLCLNAASNRLGGAKLQMLSSTGRLRTMRRHALAADGEGRRVTVNCGSAKPTWDLSGCDQEIAALACNAKATVTSETDAVLRIVGDPAAAGVSETNKVVFAGAAGLSFAGGGRLVLTSESSTRGTLEVTGGELILPEGAKWAQASAARAVDGKLTVGERAAFGRQTEVSVSDGGRVALDYTGFMRIGRLVVDGQVKPAGAYGAVGSGAMHELPCLTGTGRLHVGMVGLMVVGK